MKILFLDTNIFIQCRDLGQLPWTEVVGDIEHLLLFIPRAVQEEIDRHKQDGNTRRAKRARKASSFIRQIILSEDTKLVIKDSKPIVEISFTPSLSRDCKLPDNFDLSRIDNQIIAEIIRYRHNYPEHNVSILTHDTNPLLTAKRCGLSYYVIPDDWLLEPEPDSKDKKLLELENRIKELQNNYPVIEASWVDNSGNKINKLSVEVVLYRSFRAGEFDELINEAKRRYPMETRFPQKPPEPAFNLLPQLRLVHSMLGYSSNFVPPSDVKIAKYQNEEYPAWIIKIEKFFLSLPEKLENLSRSASFSILITNSGNVPAENTIVEFKTLGGIYLKPPSQDDENIEQDGNLVFPAPPEPPSGCWVEQKMPILNKIDIYKNLTAGHFIPRERDINAFYWKNGRPSIPVKSWIFECKEFRHKIESKSFDLTILIPSLEKDILKGRLECSISAKNLPKPANFYINFDITYTYGSIFGEAKRILNEN